MTARRPLQSTTAHLDALTATGGEGFLVISAPIPGAGRNGGPGWRAWSFPTDQVDAAAQKAADLDDRGLNVYVRANLLSRPLTSSYERGSTADTGAAVALAVDLDVAGPSHKPGAAKLPLPPDLDTAMTIVAELPPPSLNITTGGGRHLWWLLDEPEHDDPVGLLETFADRIVEAGALLGWHVDRPDPCRVLRVCGTHRRKRDVPANLVILQGLDAVAGWPVDGMACRPWVPTGRYGASELLEALPVPPVPVAPPPRPRRESRPGEVTPADAVSMLSWTEILEPYGFTYVGMGRMDGTPVELWLRPGDATSDYSIKCVPDGPCVAWSPAAGLPVGKGQKLSKFRAWCHLAGITGSDAARMVGARHREVNRV